MMAFFAKIWAWFLSGLSKVFAEVQKTLENIRLAIEELKAKMRSIEDRVLVLETRQEGLLTQAGTAATASAEKTAAAALADLSRENERLNMRLERLEGVVGLLVEENDRLKAQVVLFETAYPLISDGTGLSTQDNGAPKRLPRRE